MELWNKKKWTKRIIIVFNMVSIDFSIVLIKKMTVWGERNLMKQMQVV